MRRKWSLHLRNGYFYAQIFNAETGRFMTAKSTGATTKDEAVLVVAEWLRSGLPTGPRRELREPSVVFTAEGILEGIRKADLSPEDAGRIVEALKEKGLVETAVVKSGPGSELLKEFLHRFWNFDSSPYVREKLAHGHRIGKRHCYESLNRIMRYWIPYFEGRRIADIAKTDLKDFALNLSERGFARNTINRVVVAGTTALRWAFENGLIPVDPSDGLMRFAADPKKRGVLSTEEAARLFQLQWKDERSRIGNLVAMTTGLRAGEVLGLRVEDIGTDRLFIRHSWNGVDGLKCPKNGEERTVPLIPAVREELLSLVRSNPWGGIGTDYVFYSTIRDRPMDHHFLIDGLKESLIRLSVGTTKSEKRRTAAAEEWKARNVVFHSWRHYYSARMADRLNARQLMLTTGHKTEAVFQAYADHANEETFRLVGETAADVFSNVVAFKAG